MLSIQEREQIREFAEVNVPSAVIARRLGRSVGAVYKYRKLVDVDSTMQLPKSTKAELKVIPKRSKRVETAAGEQAQVDWGSFGTVLINGKREKLYGFFYILSFSRAIYVEFTIRQNQQTLQECHINAFKALGIPKVIRYDNMKTVVVSNHRMTGVEGRVVKYNEWFLDFAKYYKFTPEACPPYWPRAKGKVEATVKYIKSNFAPDASIRRKFVSLDHLNKEVQQWITNVAHRRIHKTTLATPESLFALEKPRLQHIDDLPPYLISPTETRRSTKDGMIAFKGNFYSVPMQFAGRKLSIREINNRGDKQICVYKDDQRVASHRVANTKGTWIVDEQHDLQEVESGRKMIKSVKQPRTINRRKYTDVAARPLAYYDSLIINKETGHHGSDKSQ